MNVHGSCHCEAVSLDGRVDPKLTSVCLSSDIFFVREALKRLGNRRRQLMDLGNT